MIDLLSWQGLHFQLFLNCLQLALVILLYVFLDFSLDRILGKGK